MPRRKIVKGGEAPPESEDVSDYELKKPENVSRVRELVADLPENAPPVIRQLLKSWGDAEIFKARICRVPLHAAIQKVGNLLTLGKLEQMKQKLGYNDLFHLYVEVALRKPDGQKGVFKIEKNEKAGYTATSGGVPAGASCLDQPPTKQVTLLEAFKRAEKSVGPRKLWVYDLESANCQDFAIAFLGSGNGMLTAAGRTFAKQEPAKLLPPLLLGAARKVTNLASRLRSLFTGRGLSGGVTPEEAGAKALERATRRRREGFPKDVRVAKFKSLGKGKRDIIPMAEMISRYLPPMDPDAVGVTTGRRLREIEQWRENNMRKTTEEFDRFFKAEQERYERMYDQAKSDTEVDQLLKERKERREQARENRLERFRKIDEMYNKLVDSAYKTERTPVQPQTQPAVKMLGSALDQACWKGYTAVGMKTKRGRKVPNCVPVGGYEEEDSDSEEECECKECSGGASSFGRDYYNYALAEIDKNITENGWAIDQAKQEKYVEPAYLKHSVKALGWIPIFGQIFALSKTIATKIQDALNAPGERKANRIIALYTQLNQELERQRERMVAQGRDEFNRRIEKDLTDSVAERARRNPEWAAQQQTKGGRNPPTYSARTAAQLLSMKDKLDGMRDEIIARTQQRSQVERDSLNWKRLTVGLWEVTVNAMRLHKTLKQEVNRFKRAPKDSDDERIEQAMNISTESVLPGMTLAMAIREYRWALDSYREAQAGAAQGSGLSGGAPKRRPSEVTMPGDMSQMLDVSAISMPDLPDRPPGWYQGEEPPRRMVIASPSLPSSVTSHPTLNTSMATSAAAASRPRSRASSAPASQPKPQPKRRGTIGGAKARKTRK